MHYNIFQKLFTVFIISVSCMLLAGGSPKVKKTNGLTIIKKDMKKDPTLLAGIEFLAQEQPTIEMVLANGVKRNANQEAITAILPYTEGKVAGALDLAIRKNDAQQVKQFLVALQESSLESSYKQKTFEAALAIALAWDNLEVITCFANSGFDITTSILPRTQLTPLAYAAKNKKTNALAVLTPFYSQEEVESCLAIKIDEHRLRPEKKSRAVYDIFPKKNCEEDDDEKNNQDEDTDYETDDYEMVLTEPIEFSNQEEPSSSEFSPLKEIKRMLYLQADTAAYKNLGNIGSQHLITNIQPIQTVFDREPVLDIEHKNI